MNDEQYKILRSIVVFFLTVLTGMEAQAQALEVLHEGGTTNLRGLAVYKNAIWVSGDRGKTGKSLDGGKTWNWLAVAGYENVDFRDVELLNEKTAIIMGISSPAYILKTTDGGITWQLTYYNAEPEMFLDAMSITKKGRGMVVGDPIKNAFFTAKTISGDGWQKFPSPHLPEAVNGEAFFAASGSNLQLSKKSFYLVSGGVVSRLFTPGKVRKLPIMQGGQTTGANSVAVLGKYIAVVGGDFMLPNKTDSVFAISYDKGRSWQLPVTPPTGYRSCVCFVNKKILVACGINGVDISKDKGMTWKQISKISYNTCIFDKRTQTVYLAGKKSGVGKISFPNPGEVT
ncbi:MAG: oxidoreductase [Niabella sp.]